MPRISISLPEVAAAFEKLLSQGEQPTAEKIQSLLNKGTIAAIQKHLKQIAEQSRLDLVMHTEKPADITEPKTEPEVTPVVISATQTANGNIVTAPAVQPAEPVIESTADAEAQASPSQDPAHPKRFNKRERFTNHRHNHSSHQGKAFEFEEVIETPLENLSEETLIAKIRRLESSLIKEQMRREVSERIAEETKDYAESIKEQVGQRINELRENMDIVIEQLKTQLREQKQNFDQDLKYYQEQLSKANEKIADLLK